MRKPLTVLLAASLILAGCGGWSDARVNPRNWFGNSRSAPVDINTDAGAVNPLIPRRSAISKRPEEQDNRVAIATITELRVERTTTGAIIHVTGVGARQGGHGVGLRLDPVDDANPASILSYTFLVDYPKDPTAVGTERTRTIHAARSLTNQELRGIRLIRVKAQQNSMETRRR